MTDMKEILRLLRAAKESELEVINQLIVREESGCDKCKGERDTKKADSDKPAERSYDDMTAAELYKLCCQRGLSGKCKSRKKADLIAVLDSGAADKKNTEEKSKSGRKKKETDNLQKQEDDGEDWGEEEENEINYESMTAKQLYEECVNRGIEVEKRKKSSDYIKLLKADDAGSDADSDDDENWEFD